MSRKGVKLPAVAEMEAVMGRELTDAERGALYGMPGGVGRLNASKRRFGSVRRELLSQAARLQEKADECQASAKALRSMARGLSAHRGVADEDWASLITVRLSEGGAVCPECGSVVAEPRAGRLECPVCGSGFECRRGGGDSWLTTIGPESRPMADIACLAKGASHE